MDKIKAMREKYAMPSKEELNHSFDTRFQHTKESLRKQEEHLFESQMKIQQLESEVKEIKDSVSKEKELLNSKLQELSVLDKHVDELKSDKKTLLQEVHELEMKRNTIRNTRPNVRDQQILEHGLQKLKLYKQLMGIRWDFGAPKKTVKGYITNGMDYIHSFNYNKNKQGLNLEASLWKEIENAVESKQDSEGIEEKEVPDD